MNNNKNDLVFRYIRNLNDDDLLKQLKQIYEYGYTDGYNGNDMENEFNELLDEIYQKATK
jgi:hypothetical protein